jgi:hypothetical protein
MVGRRPRVLLCPETGSATEDCSCGLPPAVSSRASSCCNRAELWKWSRVARSKSARRRRVLVRDRRAEMRDGQPGPHRWTIQCRGRTPAELSDKLRTEAKPMCVRTNEVGACSRNQPWPSARGTSRLSPTAAQSVLGAHDTRLKWLSIALAGLGVLRSCQLVPFQPSANVNTVPAGLR